MTLDEINEIKDQLVPHQSLIVFGVLKGERWLKRYGVYQGHDEKNISVDSGFDPNGEALMFTLDEVTGIKVMTDLRRIAHDLNLNRILAKEL